MQYLCWSLFLKELQTLSPETLLKKDANTGFFLLILRNFSEQYYEEPFQTVTSKKYVIRVTDSD